jgi:RNA polymerase sigma-70 factor, ECF subfamily
MGTATVRKAKQPGCGIPPLARSYTLRLVASPPTDYALAQAVACGASTALADLYDRYKQRVYAVCLRMTHDAADAEDLTHEVFVHLLDKAGSFRGDSKFSTWLHRVTVNLVLMHFRRRNSRVSQFSDELETRLVMRRFNRTPASMQIADRIALDSALAKLPLGCRSVFILYDIEGYKHDEISGLLGCSVGTSKSQLYRARMKLRKLMTTRLPTF